MDKETLINVIKEIGTCEDQVDRIAKLSSLTDEVSNIFDNIDSLNNQIQALNESKEKDKEQIDKLQKVNMDLFLKTGVNVTQKELNKNSTGIESEPDEKLKFEDLFK